MPYQEERTIREWEDAFPLASGQAFAAARAQALGANLSILESVVVAPNEKAIYEVFPNGHRRFVAKIPPSVSVSIDQIFEMQ